MNNRFKFRIAVYERQQNNMPWVFVEYIDPNNQHWGLNQCGDIISDSSYSAHYTRENAPDSVHRVYEPEMSTGLKDKNGNLIYEGDLIKTANYKTGCSEIYVVKWCDECGLYQLESTQSDQIIDMFRAEKGTTCGNIHEQAEQKRR